MKKIKILYPVVLLLCSMSVFSQNKDVIVGKWMNKDANSHITIYHSAGKYLGRIVWLKEPNDAQGKPKMDKNNPDESLRKRPLLGTEILKGFTYTGNNTWEGGTIYDPRTGRTYSSRITLPNANRMDVRGFVGIAALGKTETFTRVR